ncbi:MAG: hypothetical protein NDI61_03600 [Bdellovibrionaceae bacterium]|nr:hypothetical protein [Pseudobdellovibrionaceae bacterium]
MKLFRAFHRADAIFFIGAFASAIGTHTFPSAGLAFMKQAGLTLSQIGLIMMLTRIATVIANFGLGDFIDRINPIRLILAAEITNLFVTAGLVIVWPAIPNYFVLFVILVYFRSSLIALTGPSQSKFVKSAYGHNASSLKAATVGLNVVSYGSVVFATLLAWYAIQYRNFQFILIIDGFTFLLNGLLLWMVSSHIKVENSRPIKATGPFEKFKTLRNLNPSLFRADIFLHLAVFGTNLLMVRLAGDHLSWIPILLVTFGIAVWISGFMYQRFDHIKVVRWSWFGITTAFIIMYLFRGHLEGLVIATLLRNVAYWNIFNHHSVEIQKRSHATNVARLSSARTALNAIILGLGELVMGLASPHLSLATELIVRFIVVGLFAVSCLLSRTYETS